MYGCAELQNKMYFLLWALVKKVCKPLLQAERDYNRDSGSSGIKEETETSGSTVLQQDGCEGQRREKASPAQLLDCKHTQWTL